MMFRTSLQHFVVLSRQPLQAHLCWNPKSKLPVPISITLKFDVANYVPENDEVTELVPDDIDYLKFHASDFVTSETNPRKCRQANTAVTHSM